MAIVIGAWCALAMSENAVAQELLHSRVPLPGLSDTSQVAISIEIAPTQQPITPAFILETLQPRLEKIGYNVLPASTHSPDGLWLQVDCQSIQEKNGVLSTDTSRPFLRKAPRFGPPCQLTYRYQDEVVPWINVERLISSESVATMPIVVTCYPLTMVANTILRAIVGLSLLRVGI